MKHVSETFIRTSAFGRKDWPLDNESLRAPVCAGAWFPCVRAASNDMG